MWYLIKWITFIVSSLFLEIADIILCLLSLIFFFRPSKEFEFKGRVKTGEVVPIMPYINPNMVNFTSTVEPTKPIWVTVHYSQKFYKNYYDYFFRKEPKEIKKWTVLTYVGK